MRSSTMKTNIFAVIQSVKGMVGKMAMAWVLCALAACSLWGCAGKDARGERTVSGFAFDTTYSITAFQGGSQEVLDGCISKCSEYERIFSRTSPDSEVYQVNEIERLYEQFREEGAIRENRSVKNQLDFQIREDGSLACGVSRELYDILEKGLHYGRVSQGAFDITIAPVSSLWDFKGEKKGVPGRERIRDAVGKVSYEKISLEEGAVVFKEPGMALDLGGIAKGYIAETAWRAASSIWEGLFYALEKSRGASPFASESSSPSPIGMRRWRRFRQRICPWCPREFTRGIFRMGRAGCTTIS